MLRVLLRLRGVSEDQLAPCASSVDRKDTGLNSRTVLAYA